MSDTFDHEGDAWDSLNDNDDNDDNDEGYAGGNVKRRRFTGGYVHSSAPSCKRCGKTGLNWQHDGERWVLHEGARKVHRCQSTNAIEDDFEVVS